MSWIKSVPYEQSDGRLRTIYDRVKGPGGGIDNILMVHGLRPHTLEGHMAIYKSVLHHSGNSLPKSFLELLGVYVSLLNECSYCVEHHFAGLKKLLVDRDCAAIRDALERDEIDETFDLRERVALHYARALTRSPGSILPTDIDALVDANFDDGEILEINQVVSYFAYANRTVLGLGVSTAGDVLGLSPGAADDPDDWGHR